MASYMKRTWVDNSEPPINAENLNNIENGINALYNMSGFLKGDGNGNVSGVAPVLDYLGTVSLSEAAAIIDIDIADYVSDYSELWFQFDATRADESTANMGVFLTLNNLTGSNMYLYQNSMSSQTSTTKDSTMSVGYIPPKGLYPFGLTVKLILSSQQCMVSTEGYSGWMVSKYLGGFNYNYGVVSSALTSVQFFSYNQSENMAAGSKVRIYGLRAN